MALRVLLTGFEPFAGDDRNPSAEVAEAVAAAGLPGCSTTAAVLPVRWARAEAALAAALAVDDPHLVVALGLAAGSRAVAIERVALNHDGDDTPDADGIRAVGPILEGAPAAYLATLPVERLVARLRAEGVPTIVSHSAGSYLCNHVFFHLLHLAVTARPTIRAAGFVHLPYLPEQVLDRDLPSMSRDLQLRAVRALVTETAADLDREGAERTPGPPGAAPA